MEQPEPAVLGLAEAGWQDPASGHAIIVSTEHFSDDVLLEIARSITVDSP